VAALAKTCCIYEYIHSTEIKKCTVNDGYITPSTRPTILSVIFLVIVCSSKQILRQIPITNFMIIMCS